MILHKLFAVPAQYVISMDVNITDDLPSIQVLHSGQHVTIILNKNKDNTINAVFNRLHAIVHRSVFSQ